MEDVVTITTLFCIGIFIFLLIRFSTHIDKKNPKAGTLFERCGAYSWLLVASIFLFLMDIDYIVYGIETKGKFNAWFFVSTLALAICFFGISVEKEDEYLKKHGLTDPEDEEDEVKGVND